MNKQRVLQGLENVKSNPYGKWGILNIEQRRFIKELCNSWLILDDATNMQTKEIERLNKELEKYKYSPDELNEIERLNNIIKEVREYIEKEQEKNYIICDYDTELTSKDLYNDILELLNKKSVEAIPPEVIGTNGEDGGLFDYGDKGE